MSRSAETVSNATHMSAFTRIRATTLIAVALASSVALVASRGEAADVSWSSPVTISGDIDVYTQGTLVQGAFFQSGSGVALSKGVKAMKVDGIVITVTTVAKTVADCFKYRSTVGIDVAIEALRDAWRRKKASMDDIVAAAKIDRVATVMRPYLESLI